MKQRTKHILIEILPRALWLIEFGTLAVVYNILDRGPVTTSSNVKLVVGVILSIWGIFYLVNTFYKLAKPMITKELVTTGVYKRVRHPMYSAMHILLIGIGLVFFTWVCFVVMAFFIPFWIIDCRLEESQMIDLWGYKYHSYRKRSGMFFPKIF